MKPMRVLCGLLFVTILLLTSAGSASALSIGVGFRNHDTGELEYAKRAGASVYRIDLDYTGTSGGTISGGWGEFEANVQAAWEKGITVLPILVRTTGGNQHRFLNSSDPSWGAWRSWARLAVERFGINGSFWNGKANPTPITAWEVWNEPNLPENNPILSQSQCSAAGQTYFANSGTCVQPRNYGKFLAWTAGGIQEGSVTKTAHGTTVVFAGLFLPFGGEYFGSYLEKANSETGVPNAYQGLGIHPYGLANGSTQTIEGINDARTVLNLHIPGGTSKTLWVTEVGWSVQGTEGWPAGGHPASDADQAASLVTTFNWVKGAAAEKKIDAVIWYNLRDYGTGQHWAEHCGLMTYSGDFRPAWFAFQEQAGAPKWPVPPPPPVAPIPGEDDNLGGPHVVGQISGTLDSFYRTASGGFGHSWHIAGQNGWSTETLSGSIAAGSVPHPIVQSNGVIDVFYRTSTNGLGHNYYLPGSGWFSEVLGGSVGSEPHPIVQGGKIEVFYRTSGGGLGHNWHFPAGAWGTEVLPGSVAGDPYAVVQSSGVVDVFWRSPTNGLGHNYYLPSTGQWYQQPLGGSVASDPRPITQNEKIEVFYRTTGGGLGHNWHFPAGAWGTEVLPGSVSGSPHAVVQSNNWVDVFWRTPTNELGHIYYDSSGGQWHLQNLGGSVAGEPYPVLYEVSKMDVFYRTVSGGLGHHWWRPGQSAWGQESLPGSLDSNAAMGVHALSQSNGVIDVLYRTPTGGQGHNYYSSAWFQEVLAGSL